MNGGVHNEINNNRLLEDLFYIDYAVVMTAALVIT
jgi:hypothetical protein